MEDTGLPHRILLGPGPSPVDPRVLRAMSEPLMGHLDPVFLELMDEIKDLLGYVFETGNRLTVPISGTGSAGMEAALINLIEPEDPVVVCVHGVFGARMEEMVERAGGRPVPVHTDWGQPTDINRIAETMQTVRPRALAIVHAETSTGVLQNLDGVAELAHRHDALLVVDTVTSLGGHPVGVDANGIDVCFSGTQKCLGCPPGLSPITFSERAVERLRSRRQKVSSWYLDLTLIEQYWGSERVYHHTAPISMNYALREALRLIYEEGLEARWRRHELNHRAFVAGIKAMGLNMFVAPGHRLWTLNAVRVPDGVDDRRVRSRLLERHSIEIGGGLGPLQGKIWRVGLMGAGSTRKNVRLVLEALRESLASENVSCPSGLAAAERVYEA